MVKIKYDDFVNKFKAKKTTDDCYTPCNIYAAVKDWAIKQYNIPEDAPIVRPFYPTGDYLRETYPEGCVVIDNPPFSIYSQIVANYMLMDVKFFLFAPSLTLMSSDLTTLCQLIVCCETITYANGANVSTSFCTNLGEAGIYICAELADILRQANADNLQTKSVRALDFPRNITNIARLSKLIKRGVNMFIPRDKYVKINKIGEYNIFGGGVVVGDHYADMLERAAAQPIQKNDKLSDKIPLTEREKFIIEWLNKGKNDISNYKTSNFTPPPTTNEPTLFDL